jgi:hypothetical protein
MLVVTTQTTSLRAKEMDDQIYVPIEWQVIIYKMQEYLIDDIQL